MAVVAGHPDYITGKLVRRACERHLFDLERSKDPVEDIWFDPAEADRVIRFFENLKQSKGRWRGKRLKLMAWQKFVIGCMFGWKRKSTGFRRFRTLYEEVARKNGKTTKLAGFGLYGLVGDREGGPEIYAAATKRDQARILFTEATRMVRQSGPLKRRIKIGQKALSCSLNDGTMVPLGADGDTIDGLNPSMSLIDELHAHKKREIWDVLDTATDARDQPIQAAITTAGFSSTTASVCWEQRAYSVQVLDGFDTKGGHRDDSWFAYIAALDDGDDWRDENVWIKANPSLGQTVTLDGLRRQCAQAEAVPSKQNVFKRLRLNMWTEQAELWLDLEVWRRNGAPFDRAMLDGRLCYGGIDIASKRDLASYSLIFPPIEEDPRWYLLNWSFLPSDQIAHREQKDDGIPFREWEEQGYLILTDGSRIDQDYIRKHINDSADRFEIQEIGFDPWNATHLATCLAKDGFEMREMRQGIQTFAEPSKEFEALLYAGRLAHGGNEILEWNAKHIAIKHDENLNIMPSRKRSSEKIDALMASIMALGCGIAPEEEEDEYHSDGFVVDVSTK